MNSYKVKKNKLIEQLKTAIDAIDAANAQVGYASIQLNPYRSILFTTLRYAQMDVVEEIYLSENVLEALEFCLTAKINRSIVSPAHPL